MCLHKSAVSQLDPLHGAKPFSSICTPEVPPDQSISMFLSLSFLFSRSTDQLGGPPGQFIDTGWLLDAISWVILACKVQRVSFSLVKEVVLLPGFKLVSMHNKCIALRGKGHLVQCMAV